jgi:hypothetical protein
LECGKHCKKNGYRIKISIPRLKKSMHYKPFAYIVPKRNFEAGHASLPTPRGKANPGRISWEKQKPFVCALIGYIHMQHPTRNATSTTW